MWFVSLCGIRIN